jgi:hypothetical protein
MRHDWILDVLADLRTYALTNGLPDLAERVDQTLRAARAEIRRVDPDEDDDGGTAGGAPPGERPN